MATTREISVPVRYATKDAATTTRIHAVDTGLLELDNSEAPVAITWRAGNRTFQYRLFDGHLWSKLGEGFSSRPFGIGDIQPPVPGDWSSAGPGRNVLASPLQCRVPVGPTDHIRHMAYDKEAPVGSVRYDRALAHVMDAVAGTILVDDYLWRPSLGPLIALHSSATKGLLYYAHGEDYGLRLADQRVHAFDPHDPGAVMDAVGARYPRGVEISGHVPKILIEDGYRKDAVAGAAAEAAAWEMLWWMERAVKVEDFGVDGIASVLAMRSALEAAWPRDYPGAFSLPQEASHYSHLMDHAIGRVPPLYGDIAPAIRDLLPCLRGRAGMRRSRSWELAVARAAPELSPDDDLALESLSI